MREIVEGTKTKNLAGKVTRFNPLENGLSSAGVVGGTAFGGPFAPFIAAVGGAGLGSRLGVNRMSQRDFNELAAMARNGGDLTVRKSQLENILGSQAGQSTTARAAGIGTGE